jgi:hypothetical protein
MHRIDREKFDEARLRAAGSGLCGSAAHPAFRGLTKMRRPPAAGFSKFRLEVHRSHVGETVELDH